MNTIVYFVCITLLATFLSCSDRDEDSFKEVETDLNIDIPINSLVKSHDITSAYNHKFLGSKEYIISEIVNQKENINNINNLKARSGSIILISGILDNYELNSLSFDWSYKSSMNSNIDVKESIDLLSLDYSINNGVFQVNIDKELSDLVNKIDDPNGTVKIKISGICNYNISSVANLTIPVIVKSKIIMPRFELF